MSASELLSRLSKVKPTGRGRWSACCPAHDDKSPSLAVAETDDGRVLVHCFAECSVEDILDSVGLEFDALFPPRPSERAGPVRRAFNAVDALRATAFEALVVSVAAANLSNGIELTQEDRERLGVAAERLQRAAELATDAR